MIKKLRILFFEKCLSYSFHLWKTYELHFFDGDTKNFPSSFEIAQIFIDFCIFRILNFARKQTFSEKNFSDAICVDKVVLDTLMLDFVFSFLLNNFFQKR